MSKIRPYRITVPEDALTDLTRRLANARWPERETSDGWSQGIPLGYLRELCDYWRHHHDWRRCEAAPNSLPQFVTELDGLDIHFLHIPSPHRSALPLILTHGWPGSIIEFTKVIGPLTDPTSHGGEANDAFHLVVPTLPGYGFSGKPTLPGWTMERIGRAWGRLMARLGYVSYVAQGGDWGSAVTHSIALSEGEHCRASHVNLPLVSPSPALMLNLTAQEQSALERACSSTSTGIMVPPRYIARGHRRLAMA